MPDQGGSTGDPPIIITGGSVSLEFDDGPNQLPGGGGKHHNPNKKIKRIEISGDATFAQDTPNGKVTIKIFYQ